MISGYTKYREHQAESYTPAETVLMLYDGTINFIKKAIIELNDNNIPAKALLLDKAVTIIDYLYVCLDKDKGGEIAENLQKLYEFMMLRLAEANMKNDTDMMEEVINILTTLREGWIKISAEDSKGRAAMPAKAESGLKQKSHADTNTEVKPLEARKIQIKI